MAISVDAVGTAQGVNGSPTVTISDLTPSATANYLVALVIFSNTDTSSGVTWNGVSMTLLARFDIVAGSVNHEYWGLQAPDTGNHNLVATKSGGGNYSFARLCGFSLNRTQQTYTPDNSGSNNQASAAPSITVSSTGADCLGIMICESSPGVAGTPSPGTVIAPSGLIVKKGLCAGAYANVFSSTGNHTMSYPNTVTAAYNSMIILDGDGSAVTNSGNILLLGAGA